MRRLLPTTLFGQLLLGTVLVQFVLLVVYVTYIVVSQTHVAEARARTRMAQQLDRLATACSKEMQRGDAASLHDVLELSRIAPSIDVARITDLSGNTLQVSSNGRTHGLEAYEVKLLSAPVHQQVFDLGQGELEAVAPLPKGGQPVAVLWLEPNRTLPFNTLNSILRICLSYGLFALLANVLPIFLIVRTATRPLQRLRTATQQVVSHQDLKGEFPLPVTAGNEAGDLTASFNTMVEELGKQRAGLLETVALLDSMLGNAPTGFGFFDRDLRFVKVNAYLADLFGVGVDHPLGRRASEAQPGPMMQKLEEHVNRVFETGESVRDIEVTGSLPRIPGIQRHWLIHFYPVRLEGGPVKWAGVIVVDITERLQTEEVLRRTEKLAAAGRLAAGIAHEINNPLESVTNLLYLLSTHGALDETARDFVETAQAELARVSEITQQMLRFYRQSTSPRRTDIAETVNSVLALYKSRLAAARVQVIPRLRPGTETFAFGGELRQVFANLIGNAIDAMPQGGCLYLRSRPGCGKTADGCWSSGVRVTVADTGTGMSLATRERLFEAFFTTKQATGTGLGLWISQEIVGKHAGHIDVRSRQGTHSGTVFSLFFPENGLQPQQTVEAGVLTAAS